MKAGTRALGIAESFRGSRSTLAGAVVRADRVVDDLVFGTCAVGGTDATDSLGAMWDRLSRPDVRYVLVAGIAPAWFNVLDLHALHDRVDRPVVSVTFEESEESLADALGREFSGAALEERLAVFDRQPARRRLTVGDETLFVRAVGCEVATARDVVRAFTPEGGRPEPLRVARQAARAAEEFRGAEREE